jgi:hypothetical protein
VVGTYSLLMSPTAIARAIHSCRRSRTAHDHGLAVGANSLSQQSVNRSLNSLRSNSKKLEGGDIGSAPSTNDHSVDIRAKVRANGGELVT